MKKQQRYENAQRHFMQVVREGDATAFREALKEYKSASDDYYCPRKLVEDDPGVFSSTSARDDIQGWKNILKCEGTIDPATIKHAREKIKQAGFQ